MMDNMILLNLTKDEAEFVRAVLILRADRVGRDKKLMRLADSVIEKIEAQL